MTPHAVWIASAIHTRKPPQGGAEGGLRSTVRREYTAISINKFIKCDASDRIPRVKAKSLGYKGEGLAAQYLQSKGYKILENNFTVRGGEVDLIAQDGEVLVFVEVKTRTSESFGTGDESVNFDKKQKLRRTIQRYIAEKSNLADSDYRVDLIEIELDPKTHELKKINHLKDIEI